MNDHEKDRVAMKTIKYLGGQYGLTVNELLDQLEYTKDFLLNRIVIRNVDTSALCEECKRHKKG